MMAARKNLRSSAKQIEVLVDFMSTHQNFANGEFSGPLGRRAHNDEWNRLQQILKEYGPDKNAEQWRVTWRDLKKKARADGGRVNQARAQTGNTPIPTLSETSQKILAIIGQQSAYGIGLEETGLGEISIPNLPDPSAPMNFETTDSSACTYTTPFSPLPVIPACSTSAPNIPAFSTSSYDPVIIPPSFTPPCASMSSFIPPLSIPTSSIPPSSTPPPSIPPSTSQNRRARLARPSRGRARNIASDILSSDEETRGILRDISNSLRQQRTISEIGLRRQHLDRLCRLRKNKNEFMSDK